MIWLFLDKLQKTVELNIEMETMLWDTQNKSGNYILRQREYISSKVQRSHEHVNMKIARIS